MPVIHESQIKQLFHFLFILSLTILIEVFWEQIVSFFLGKERRKFFSEGKEAVFFLHTG